MSPFRGLHQDCNAHTSLPSPIISIIHRVRSRNIWNMRAQTGTWGCRIESTAVEELHLRIKRIGGAG